MKHGIEKSKEPEHAPVLDELVPAGNLSERGDRQRHQQKNQSPIASEMGDKLDRIGA
jgi:hypothetical protein